MEPENDYNDDGEPSGPDYPACLGCPNVPDMPDGLCTAAGPCPAYGVEYEPDAAPDPVTVEQAAPVKLEQNTITEPQAWEPPVNGSLF